MERIRIKYLWLICAVFLCSVYTTSSSEQIFTKLSQEKGFKFNLDISEFAALNLSLAETTPQIQVHGETGTSANNILSGKNHNLDETFSIGEKPAIRHSTLAENIDITEITLEGTPVTESDFSFGFNKVELGAFLRNNAEIIINGDTIFQNTIIGSSLDFKILYVNDAKLTLAGNFTGYGIIYIEDITHASDEPILEMLGNAVWYGLIIVNQVSDENKISKIYLKGGSSLNIEDFALLGIESLIAGNNMTINSGYIGAFLEDGNVNLGNNAYLGSGLIADTINLGNNTTVEGDIYYNTQLTYGDNFLHNGEEITSVTLPFLSLPPFPEFEPGTQVVDIGNNTSYTLEPGDYSTVSIGNNTTLYLSGGIYNIVELDAGNISTISYLAPCEIRVKEKVGFGNTPSIIPGTEYLDASDCVFYIEGASYPYYEDVFYYDDDVFIAGNQPKIYCNIYAPNSNVEIGNNGDYQGAIIAKKITSGNNPCTSIELNSAFSSPPQYVKIVGSILCIGNNFHIPNLGKYEKVLYSQEALEKVQEKLEQAQASWIDWKEVE